MTISATLFDVVAAQIKKTVGYQLFTITRILPEGKEVERIYTTRPDVYPLAGRKPMRNDAQTKMTQSAQTYLASTTEAMVPYFPDLDTIKQLGLGSVINMPIVINGSVIGTVNILDAEHYYQASHVDQLQSFASEITAIIQEFYK